jgi:hypothetical protein
MEKNFCCFPGSIHVGTFEGFDLEEEESILMMNYAITLP